MRRQCSGLVQSQNRRCRYTFWIPNEQSPHFLCWSHRNQEPQFFGKGNEQKTDPDFVHEKTGIKFTVTDEGIIWIEYPSGRSHTIREYDFTRR